MDVLHTVTLI